VSRAYVDRMLEPGQIPRRGLGQGSIVNRTPTPIPDVSAVTPSAHRARGISSAAASRNAYDSACASSAKTPQGNRHTGRGSRDKVGGTETRNYERSLGTPHMSQHTLTERPLWSSVVHPTPAAGPALAEGRMALAIASVFRTRRRPLMRWRHFVIASRRWLRPDGGNLALPTALSPPGLCSTR
jgi:hypothetical protein